MKKVPAIPSVTDHETQGKRLYNDIYLLPEDAVDLSTPPTISEEARTMSALTIKSGEAWVRHQAVKFTAKDTNEGNGGDITTDTTGTVTYTVGGDRKEIDDFLENHHGRGFYIVSIDRVTLEKKIYGRPYCPYYFSGHSRRKNDQNTSCDITFTSPFIYQPLKYLGSVDTGDSGSGSGSGSGQ